MRHRTFVTLRILFVWKTAGKKNTKPIERDTVTCWHLPLGKLARLANVRTRLKVAYKPNRLD